MEYMEGIDRDGMEGHAMVHNTMIAHGRGSDFVDIHLYRVGFVRPDAQVGKEVSLTFEIKDLNGNPVSDLEVVHDKIMHVILVRSDLKHFDHIHPEMKEAGTFSVPYIFSASGSYRIWIDFTVDGMQHIVDFDINVPGSVETKEKDMLQGLHVNMISPTEIISGEEVELIFNVTGANNNPVSITEKFLAATAHLIEIDETLEEFGHNHDESLDNNNIISFKQTFEKSGQHRLWVQFSNNGQERIASFEVIVS